MTFRERHIAAIIRETTIRDVAFLDCPETICGVEVLPMSPRHLLLLDGSNNPFLHKPTPPVSDDAVAQMVLFLWVVSPAYVPGECRAKNRFVKSCRSLRYDQTAKRIEEYVADTFMDEPPRGKSGASYTSSMASIVDLLASQYGWSESDILNLPLKRIFQYIRRIDLRNGEKIMFNPSDRIKGEWLKARNEHSRKMRDYEADLNKPYRWEDN